MKRILILLLFFVSPIFAEKPLIIGIAGGSGSGKTTLAHRLREVYGDQVTVISQDAYYKDLAHLPPSERVKENFDHPDALDFDLMAEHLRDLKDGLTVSYPSYSFVDQTRGISTPVKPSPIILVEGILVFTVPELRELFDISLYIEARDDVRLLRRLERDIGQRGFDLYRARDDYLDKVLPMHDQFVAPSKQHADLIISTETENSNVLSLITALIQGKQASR